MHNLIPHFIQERYEAGQTQGEFDAVTLFMDISGFTTLTQSLMAYGKEGAEVLAQIINHIFEPIIEIIEAHHGFVTVFAGDALTVVFPEQNKTAVWGACQTAARIARVLIERGTQQTQYGTFVLAVKQGLAVGKVEWGIVGSAVHKTFFFRGAAIDACARAEQEAQAGDIVLDGTLLAFLPAEGVSQRPLANNYVQLLSLTDEKTEIQKEGRPLAPVPLSIATQFFPAALWNMPQQGEFRYVVPLFLSFQAADDLEVFNHFIGEVVALVDRFEGTFVEIDFGDKGGLLLIYFGAPLTHEDDQRRALDFILALQQIETAVVWRAGITAGVVYAGYIGAIQRDKYTCMGSVVNLAARLMMQAAWGEVLVTAVVAAEQGFAFETRGNVLYKGFDAPIPTLSLIGKVAHEPIFGQQLVGREEQLTTLVALAKSVGENGQAAVAIVHGEAGMGKSHLAYALRQKITPPVLWFTGQTSPIFQQAFDAFIYFLRPYFKQSAEASIEENKRHFEAKLDDLITAVAHFPHAQRVRDELLRTRSFLGALLGLEWPDSLYAQLDAQGRYQNSLLAIRSVMQAESYCQPVILLLEDGHWLDEASLELLQLLSREAAAWPLFILITSRYNDDGSRFSYPLAHFIPTTHVDLDSLTEPALRTLAEQALGKPIDAALHQLLLEKTRANPFFAQQILYYLQENGLIDEDEGTAVLSAHHTFELPVTLTTLLIARLDRLTRETKEVVQTAAVLGREFDLRLLMQMLQQDIGAMVNAAVHKQIWSLLNDLQYIFNHVLMRDAAYEMQLRARLRDVHYSAAVIGEQLYAAVLAPHYRTLAYHYEMAYLLGQTEARARAQQYLGLAGQQASANFEKGVAIDYFTRALSLTEAADVTGQYQLTLARAKEYGTQGNRPAQNNDLQALVVLARELTMAEQAAVALEQANYVEVVSDYEQTIAYAQEAIRLGQQVGALELVAGGYREWGLALWRQGQYPAAAEIFQEGLPLAEQAGATQRTVQILLGLGLVAIAQAEQTAAQSYFERALVITEATRDLSRKAAVFNNLGMLSNQQGSYTATKAYFDQAVDIYHKIGERRGAGTALHNLGAIAVQQGDFAVADTYFAQALVICHEVGDQRVEKESFRVRGYAAYLQGQYDVAHDYYKQSLTICRQLNLREAEGVCLHGLGALAGAQGEWSTAVAYYEEALAIQEALGLAQFVVENHAGLAYAWLAQGERGRARTLAEQAMVYLAKQENLERLQRPIETLYFVWQVWVGLGEATQAAQVLASAAGILQKNLDANREESLQQMYLSQSFNKAVWQAAQGA